MRHAKLAPKQGTAEVLADTNGVAETPAGTNTPAEEPAVRPVEEATALEETPTERVPLPVLTEEEIRAHFPKGGKYEKSRPEQDAYMRAVSEGKRLIEGPTGSGKSAVEVATLCAGHAKFGGPAFLIAPTKGICDQHHRDFPDLPVLYGSNEVPCMFAAAGFDREKSAATTPEQLLELYNNPKVPRRDQVPCVMINRRCPNLVNVETGETAVTGATACPYYRQEYEAKQDGRALATMSYYLYARVFGGRTQKFETPTVLVVDEAHRLADILRRSLSYEITDWYVQRAADLLDRIGVTKDAKVLRRFLGVLKRIARDRKREPYEEHLLEEEEIRRLISVLAPIDTDELAQEIARAIKSGQINLHDECMTIKKLETLCRDIRRYVHAFEYSLGTAEHPPLNYTCAFYRADREKHSRKTNYKLVIRCHHVAALVRKRLVAPLTVAFSATIGNPQFFEWDSGIGGGFFYLDMYNPDQRRLYVPRNAPDLSFSTAKQTRRDKTDALKKIAEACLRFARKGFRSLVIVVSNEERRRFLELACRVGLDAVSYGEGQSARDIAAAFKEGHGQTLLGTEAQYAEGLDFPQRTAPVIFVLRPAYPNFNSAESQFEFRRWPKEKGRVWALRNHRAMVKAFQACGRNVRGTGREDGGVTIFVDARFRKLVPCSLPDTLKPSYRGNMDWEETLADAESFLGLVFGKPA